MVLMFDWNAGSTGNLRWEYSELLETTGINWKSGLILKKKILSLFGFNYCQLQIKSVNFTCPHEMLHKPEFTLERSSLLPYALHPQLRLGCDWPATHG